MVINGMNCIFTRYSVIRIKDVIRNDLELLCVMNRDFWPSFTSTKATYRS